MDYIAVFAFPACFNSSGAGIFDLVIFYFTHIVVIFLGRIKHPGVLAN